MKGAAGGAARLDAGRAGPPGVQGGSGVEAQPASIATAANDAHSGREAGLLHVCNKPGRRARTSGPGAGQLPAAKRYGGDADRIMGRLSFLCKTRVFFALPELA